LVRDSLVAGGRSDIQNLYGLGDWAFFRRAGAPERRDQTARCPAGAPRGGEGVGHEILAYLTESPNEVAWLLYVQKACLRVRAGQADEAVTERVTWQLYWTPSGWRIGPRSGYERTPERDD